MLGVGCWYVLSFEKRDSIIAITICAEFIIIMLLFYVYTFDNFQQNFNYTLCKKCPTTNFFLVHIFSIWTEYGENSDQEKFCIWTIFTQWEIITLTQSWENQDEWWVQLSWFFYSSFTPCFLFSVNEAKCIVSINIAR